LERLEKSRIAKPKIVTVRDGDVNHQTTANGAVYSPALGPNRKSSMQATTAVQTVSLESAARH
jgi:hypothetical protein